VLILLFFSFSMLTTAEVLAPRIRLGGEPNMETKFRAPVADDYRSGLVAYHILQSGVSCRLPKTPRSESLFLHANNLPNFRAFHSTSQSCEPLLRRWCFKRYFLILTDGFG
jgi:hypothetical protein